VGGVAWWGFEGGEAEAQELGAVTEEDCFFAFCVVRLVNFIFKFGMGKKGREET